MTKWGFRWRSSILKQERPYSGGPSRLPLDYIEKWGGDKFYTKQDLLAKGFLLPTLSTSILFICFWIDLVRVLVTTGNTSTSRASIPEKLHHCQRSKEWFTWHSISIIAEINRMLITRPICMQSLQYPTIAVLLIKILIFFDHSVVFASSKVINAFKR